MAERAGQLVALLPRGGRLDDESWRRRHRLLLVLLALHVPFLAAVGLGSALPAAHLALEVVPLLAFVALGATLRGRVMSALVVTFGLVVAASLLVHLTGGLTEAHFHYFVVLGFVALYQDWRPYLLAVVYVLASHGLLGLISDTAVFADEAARQDPWRWALIHGGFVVAACVAHLVFWDFNERQQEKARRYYRELYEGERALGQAQTLKDELFSVVGHEFRTPLTAIQGYARLLTARLEALDAAGAQRGAEAIEREAKRLSRAVSNLLAASQEPEPEVGASTELASLSLDVVSDVLELAPVTARDLSVHLPAGHSVAMGRNAAYEVLYNLLENAVKFGDPDAAVQLSSRRDGSNVVIEISNVGPPIDDRDRDRIFEPFVQVDSSETRRYGGMGIGLHVVRKLVTAHAGSVTASCDGEVVVVRAVLPAAETMTTMTVPELSSAV